MRLRVEVPWSNIPVTSNFSVVEAMSLQIRLFTFLPLQLQLQNPTNDCSTLIKKTRPHYFAYLTPTFILSNKVTTKYTMAPTRQKKRKSTESTTSLDVQSFPAPPQLLPTKEKTPARTPTNRSPIRKSTMGITLGQKQALIDNLQLESMPPKHVKGVLTDYD
jgi:hypothetical protein